MKTDETEDLERILASLQNVSDIEGAAIITRNGILISSNLPPDIDGQKFAAMSASMVGASETAAALLKSFAKRIIVEIERGKILALGTGPRAILVVSISEKADTEKITSVLEQYRKDIMKIFK